MARSRTIDREELTRLYLAGWGYSALAKHFGARKNSMWRLVVNLGIRVEGRGHKKRTDRGSCEHCGAPLNIDQKRFCSHGCSASVTNIGVTRSGTPGRFQRKACAHCGKEHKNPKYCSRSCAVKDRHAHRNPEERAEAKRLKNLLGVRRYQAKLFGQTPPDADREKIKAFYAACPDGYEVDHIIPISRGGLHHQDNLQYLPALDNRRKGNKLNWTRDAEMAEGT